MWGFHTKTSIYVPTKAKPMACKKVSSLSSGLGLWELGWPKRLRRRFSAVLSKDKICMSWCPPLLIFGWRLFCFYLCRMEEVLGSFVRKMVMTEDEAVEVVLPTSVVDRHPKRFFLVGELLSHKPYRKEALIGTMWNLWIPKNGPLDRSRFTAVCLENCDQILFSFKFEADLKWVVKGSLWAFENALFSIAVTDGLVDPMDVSLDTQFFWIWSEVFRRCIWMRKLVKALGKL